MHGSAIRIYDGEKRWCYNFDVGIRVVREIARLWTFKAVGSEEGAMVVHMGPKK